MRIFLLLFVTILLFADDEFNLDENNSPYRLTSYKSNYLLPYTYDFAKHNDGRMHQEAKFRLSFKRPVTMELFGFDAALYLAYTQLSLWQVWDEDKSSPFRETNYNPEIFVHIPNHDHTFIRWWRIGYEHESNGQDLPVSRSWDRLSAVIGAEHDNWNFEFKGWFRKPEKSKKDDEDTKGDDNPDIHRYYGIFEINTAYKYKKNQFRAVVRHGTEKGSIELSWNYLTAGKLYFYTQFFDGYGESLIDYNHRVQKLGFGVMFSRGN